MNASASDPPRSPAEARAARLAADRARRRERLARKQEAIEEARARFSRGATIAQLLPWWRERTGFSRSTLYKAVHGIGDAPARDADRGEPEPRRTDEAAASAGKPDATTYGPAGPQDRG